MCRDVRLFCTKNDGEEDYSNPEIAAALRTLQMLSKGHDAEHVGAVLQNLTRVEQEVRQMSTRMNKLERVRDALVLQYD